MLNARNIPVIQGSRGIQPWADWHLTNASVGIVAPIFLNLQDLQAGGCRPNWLCFNRSLWQQGGNSKNPQMRHPISSFLALDQLLDQLFLNTTFPRMNQVVVAGHSLGGQAAQRYAVLKKTKAYDPNVRYWIGNPGSWAYITTHRPNQNESGANTFDTWPYGIHQNTSKVPSYARRDVVAQNGTLVAERYRNRTVGYGLALMDVGAGVTSPPAMWQGYSHLDRGAKFVISLGQDFQDGFPATHTADFIANVTHQDYSMYTTNMTLQRLFWDGLHQRNPWLAQVVNPGDKPLKHHHNQTHHHNSSTDGSHRARNGTHTFATSKHKNLARGLLSGPCGLAFLCYLVLPWLFPPNYDPSFEEQPPPTRG